MNTDHSLQSVSNPCWLDDVVMIYKYSGEGCNRTEYTMLAPTRCVSTNVSLDDCTM